MRLIAIAMAIKPNVLVLKRKEKRPEISDIVQVIM